MRRILAIGLCGLLGIVSLSVATSTVHRQERDSWEPLRFLLGTWTGEGSSKQGDIPSGAATFAFDLDKKIMVRKNRDEIAPKSGEVKGTVHEDLMIIYPQSGTSSFRAVYFDSEGHVINYGVSIPSKRSLAVFESDPTDKAPRFRLVYESGAAGALNTDFQIAPPGSDFKSYVKGTMKKSH